MRATTPSWNLQSMAYPSWQFPSSLTNTEMPNVPNIEATHGCSPNGIFWTRKKSGQKLVKCLKIRGMFLALGIPQMLAAKFSVTKRRLCVWPSSSMKSRTDRSIPCSVGPNLCLPMGLWWKWCRAVWAWLWWSISAWILHFISWQLQLPFYGWCGRQWALYLDALRGINSNNKRENVISMICFINLSTIIFEIFLFVLTINLNQNQTSPSFIQSWVSIVN